MMQSWTRWFVVQTRPHAEHKAAAHLARQGFDCYLPRYLKRRRHAGKTEIVPAALFPRYMFVAVGEAQQWRSIRSTIGVSQLVCSGEDPAPVPDRVIEELRAREDANGFIKLSPRPAFPKGARVRVVDGIFVDRLALYDDLVDCERVAVLLEILGRKVRVVIDKNKIVEL